MNWIKMQQKQPAHGRPCLASNGRGVFIGWYAHDTESWYKVASRDLIEVSCPISHWMPLPEPPEGE